MLFQVNPRRKVSPSADDADTNRRQQNEILSHLGSPIIQGMPG